MKARAGLLVIFQALGPLIYIRGPFALNVARPAAPNDWGTTVWHPLLSALEIQPGRWQMLDGFDQPHALIEFVKRGPEVGYKAVTWAPGAADRQLIGYYLTLRAATKAAHMRYVGTLGNQGPPMAWGQPTTSPR